MEAPSWELLEEISGVTPQRQVAGNIERSARWNHPRALKTRKNKTQHGGLHVGERLLEVVSKDMK